MSPPLIQGFSNQGAQPPMHMAQAKSDTCWKSWIDWCQHKNNGSWDIQIETHWRACTLVLADLRLTVAKVPDHLWEKAKMASHPSFLQPCSWAVPSHTDSVLQHGIYCSQDQVDHKHKRERCLCPEACPLLLYLVPRDHDEATVLGNEWPCGEARYPSPTRHLTADPRVSPHGDQLGLAQIGNCWSLSRPWICRTFS